MRLLFIGDIVGRSGRDAVIQHLPCLQQALKPHLIIANAENAAGGFGITEKIAQQFLDAGIGCLTTGNHVWDQKEMISAIERLPRVLRPINLPEGTPGRGAALIPVAEGRKVLVINAIARLFMEPQDDPFAATERILRPYGMPAGVAAIVVDFHGEATSEKMAFGHFLDGRVSAVIGSHSHVPTADAQVLPRGTAYLSDAGMTGDYDSVIGMKKEGSIHRFVRKLPGERMSPAEQEATLCGAFIETDDISGLARRIEPIRLGGRLQQTMPAAVETPASGLGLPPSAAP